MVIKQSWALVNKGEKNDNCKQAKLLTIITCHLKQNSQVQFHVSEIRKMWKYYYAYF